MKLYGPKSHTVCLSIHFCCSFAQIPPISTKSQLEFIIQTATECEYFGISPFHYRFRGIYISVFVFGGGSFCHAPLQVMWIIYQTCLLHLESMFFNSHSAIYIHDWPSPIYAHVYFITFMTCHPLSKKKLHHSPQHLRDSGWLVHVHPVLQPHVLLGLLAWPPLCSVRAGLQMVGDARCSDFARGTMLGWCWQP